MFGILTVAVFTLLAGYSVWSYYIVPKCGKSLNKNNGNAVYIIILTAAALFLRIILSSVYRGHKTDMNCFIGWANAVFEHGFGNFYELDMFHDYPPGYMFVLYVVGAIQKLFGFQDGAQYILIKLPAVICDIITGIVIYRIAKNKLPDDISAMIAAIYLFNPASIVNSSLWGQVDSVYTLFVLLMIYMITEKKMIISYFLFSLCIFIKPQSFVFTPVLIYGFVENVFLTDFSVKKLFSNIAGGLGAIVMIFILALPFGIGNVTDQYKATMSSYPHLTVNAFNIWGALGKNWEDLSTVTSVIGYILIAAIAVYSFCILIKSKDKSKYFFAGAMLAFMTYMLSTKMHDRYAFPAMVLLLMAFLISFDRRNYLMYILVTVSQFFNTSWVLFIYETDTGKYFRSTTVTIASLINVALLIFIIYLTHKMYFSNNIQTEISKKSKALYKSNTQKKQTKPAASGKKFTMAHSAVMPKLTRTDAVIMAVITILYAGIALYDLGDTHAPQSEYILSDNNDVTIDLGSDVQVGGFEFYLGSYELNESRSLNIKCVASDGADAYSKALTSGSVFKWDKIDVDAEMRYITLSANNESLSIKEFAVLDTDGNLIAPDNITPSEAENIFDEQSEAPERSTFRNSTYFDEIYHARTGYEFVHGLSVYEWTHPPLGKVFIAAGIKLFGMTPFGWRIAGTVFGIIMAPVIYMFALSLLKKSWLAAITCTLFTFDFMHFTQTRIATIDVYITFFVILMFYFMYQYYSMSFYDTHLRKTLAPLAFSGISMGLAVASKWTGVYAGVGLAIVFFITIYKRYNEYLYAMNKPDGQTEGISHAYIIQSFKPNFIKTIIWCCIFFVIVPIIIYCASYFMYLKAPDMHGLKSIIENAQSMYTYHSKTVLNSEHPYSSRWYEWLIMRRPVWYYSGTVSDGVKEGISAFGNPLVWWVGLPAFIYMVYLICKKKDMNCLFLVIAYTIQILFWIPIKRLTFIYHYFPMVPFLTLIIGYSIKELYNNAESKKKVMYGAFVYTGLVIILFAMFYPVLSGQPCSVWYAEHFLKWFDSWVLL